MSALLDVILPVFLVIGFGYAVVRASLLSEPAVDGLMRFAQNFAVPCLLFRSIAHLDLSAAYDVGLMASFYTGAFAGFFACFFGAMLVFRRAMPDAVSIGSPGSSRTRSSSASPSPSAPTGPQPCRETTRSSRCTPPCSTGSALP